MSAFLISVGVFEAAVCLLVAALLARRWRHARSTATSSAFGIFAIVAAVIAAGAWQPADPTRGWGAVYVEVLILILLALPYLLTRFTWALGAISDRTHLAMAGLYALQVVITLAAPPLPPEGAPRAAWVLAYTAVVVLVWCAQSAVAAVALWRAGRGESAVVRHRMRSLALGAVVMAATIVLSAGAGGESTGVAAVALPLLGLMSIVLFALAFLLPASLRLVWRQEDLSALAEAERGLMAANTRDQVAATIVPVLASVLGGAAALIDAHRTPVHTSGRSPAGWETFLPLLGQAPAGTVREIAPGAIAAGMHEGWLVVEAGRLAPVFGDNEAVVLSRVATLVDLALQRVQLFDRERTSRQTAEAVNADLETLLYSVSHDLRSPLISVLGYLDVLRQEHAGELTGDGPHYLERISVNAVYMQSLIADLLELSRVGRNDGPVGRLDLHDVARQVLDAAGLQEPAADLEVVGSLPAVLMTDVRARQLLTNLVDNALKHGGRDDLRVTVRAVDAEDGGLLLQVADDGVGVPAEYRDRVLRVFERLDAPKSSPGTGMGLAICKRICESVGGSIVIGGPAAGASTGATVSVLLPATVRIAAPASGTAPVPAPRDEALLPTTHEEMV
jgi:signal transduction histidine kinase